MLDEREALNLLRAIADLAILGHPYDRDSSSIGAALVLTLEQIWSVSAKAIYEHESRKVVAQRPMGDRDRTIHD